VLPLWYTMALHLDRVAGYYTEVEAWLKQTDVPCFGPAVLPVTCMLNRSSCKLPEMHALIHLALHSARGILEMAFREDVEGLTSNGSGMVSKRSEQPAKNSSITDSTMSTLL